MSMSKATILKEIKKRKTLFLNLLAWGNNAQLQIEGRENIPMWPRKDDFSWMADWESLPTGIRRDIEFSLKLDS